MAHEAHWKRLVAELKSRHHDSVYLDRLCERLPSVMHSTGGGGLEALQAEIVAESAASLGRAEDKVNFALLQLELLGAEIDALEAAPRTLRSALDAKRAEHEARREDARLALHHFVIHREALGFACGDAFFALYPLPRRRV